MLMEPEPRTTGEKSASRGLSPVEAGVPDSTAGPLGRFRPKLRGY